MDVENGHVDTARDRRGAKTRSRKWRETERDSRLSNWLLAGVTVCLPLPRVGVLSRWSGCGLRAASAPDLGLGEPGTLWASSRWPAPSTEATPGGTADAQALEGERPGNEALHCPLTSPHGQSTTALCLHTCPLACWGWRPGRSLLPSLPSPKLGRASSTKHHSFPFGPLPLNSLIWDRYWE